MEKVEMELKAQIEGFRSLRAEVRMFDTMQVLFGVLVVVACIMQCMVSSDRLHAVAFLAGFTSMVVYVRSGLSLAERFPVIDAYATKIRQITGSTDALVYDVKGANKSLRQLMDGTMIVLFVHAFMVNCIVAGYHLIF